MALSVTGRAIFFLFLIEKNERMAAKKVTAKKKIASSKSATTQLHTRRWAKWLVPIILVLSVIGILLSVIPFGTKTRTGPQFQKEGTLQFISTTGRSIEKIDIEIADDEITRQQGLMWRRSMKEDQGMLFIMESQKPQSFWMLNTYLPLDIIFVNDQFQIVKIRPNTKPQSLDQVTSVNPALYVVEVNAGFAQERNLKEGDKIQFEKASK